MESSPLVQFYRKAKAVCILRGYGSEIDTVESRHFDGASPEEFLHQYVWVVLNAGMKNQVAQGIFQRFFDSKCDLQVIRHRGKRSAIRCALREYEKWYTAMLSADSKPAYLETLPWIGPVTKYHLARNLGLDVAKPDRHLTRLADHFGFRDVQEMCQNVSLSTGDRVGVVDVVLWRASNLGMKPIHEKEVA